MESAVGPVLPSTDVVDSSDCGLEVTLSRVSNLNWAKGGDLGWDLVVKMFLLRTDLVAELGRVEVNSRRRVLDQRLTLPITVSSCQDIDALVHFPLLVNFYESFPVLAKEKRSEMEEKLQLLGQVSVDLLPLVRGCGHMEGSWTICPTVSSNAGDAAMDTACCDLSFRVLGSVVPPSFLNNFNIFSVGVHSCHSIPEAWLPTPVGKLACKGFTLATALPQTNDQQRLLLASNNALVTKPSPVLETKKWPTHPAIVSDAIFRQEKMRTKNYLKEVGHFSAPDRWTERYHAETNLPCVPINTEFRCVLSRDAERIFLSNLVASPVLPFEIFQVNHPETKHAATKKKGKIEEFVIASEEPVLVRHGVALVNLKPLLNPGATSITGAYPVKSYGTSQLNDGVKYFSLAAGILKSFASTMTKPSTAIQENEPNRLSVASKKVMDHGRPSHSDHQGTKKNQEPLVDQSADLADCQMYEDSKTYIYLEITLDKPLIEKKVDTEIIGRLKELIVFPEKANSKMANFAETLLREQMEAMYRHFAQLFIDENQRLQTQQISGKSFEAGRNDDRTPGGSLADLELMENGIPFGRFRQKMEFHLIDSGDFHVLKEQLRLKTACLVREKYQPSTNPRDSDLFLSDLYVELTQHVQVTGRKMERYCHRAPQDPQLSPNLENLHILAMEAELEEEFGKAENFLKKRTEFSPTDPAIWQDLGSFFLRCGKFADAEIAFKEILMNDWTNFNGLLLNGYVQIELANFGKATTFFEAAVFFYPNSALAWSSLGIFNQINSSADDGIVAVSIERAYKEAKRASGIDDLHAEKYEIFLAAIAEKGEMERLAASGVREQAKIRQQIPSSMLPPRPKSGSKSKKELKGCRSESPREREKQRGESARLATLFHDLNFVFPVEVEEENWPVENVFWLVISAFASLGMHKMTNFCVDRLSEGRCDLLDPLFWRSTVLSYIEQRRFRDAELFLGRLLLLDVETADLFAILGHVKYLQGDYKQAADNYRRALRLTNQVSDFFVLYFRFARLSEMHRHHKRAKEMFFRAAKLRPTCRTWLGCGRACYHLGETQLAETILQEANCLDNRNPQVWAYLALANLQFGRVEVAERCNRAAKVFGIAAFPQLIEQMDAARAQLLTEGAQIPKKN